MGAVLSELTPIGGGKHLRVRLEKFGEAYDAVFFHQTPENLGLRAGDCVDAAFFPQVNEFRQQRSVQLLLSDLRRHDAAAEARILSGVYPAAAATLPREDFVTLWRALNTRGGAFTDTLDRFCAALCPALDVETLCLCLKVFEDIGHLSISLDGDKLSVCCLDSSVKLDDSPLLARLRRGECA